MSHFSYFIRLRPSRAAFYKEDTAISNGIVPCGSLLLSNVILMFCIICMFFVLVEPQAWFAVGDSVATTICLYRGVM